MVSDKNTMLPSPNTILFRVFCCAFNCERRNSQGGMTHSHAGGMAMTQRWSRPAVQGSEGAGEAPSMLSLLATLTKDAVTSSWHLLTHSLPKIAPYVHLLPSDLIFSEHK